MGYTDVYLTTSVRVVQHIWMCSKNDANDTEYKMFEDSVDEVLKSTLESPVMQNENILREATRGLINEKWWRTCKLKIKGTT
ncbi:unnamed protein product [Rhizophagus irregularis]|nr:unnamed protein product [Rhizophagus irregularis]